MATASELTTLQQHFQPSSNTTQVAVNQPESAPHPVTSPVVQQHNTDYVTNPTHYIGNTATQSNATVFDVDHLSSIFNNVVSQQSLEFQVKALPSSWLNQSPEALAELVRNAQQLLSDIAPFANDMPVGADTDQTPFSLQGNFLDHVSDPNSAHYGGVDAGDTVSPSYNDNKSAATDSNGMSENPNKVGFSIGDVGGLYADYRIAKAFYQTGTEYAGIIESGETAELGASLLASGESLFVGTMAEGVAASASTAIGATVGVEAIGALAAGGLVAVAIAGVALAGYEVYKTIQGDGVDTSSVTSSLRKITDFFDGL